MHINGGPLLFISGFVTGAVFSAMLAWYFQKRSMKSVSERERAVVDELRTIFGSLSLEALSRANDEFLKLAQSTLSYQQERSVQDLETKKSLIDRQLADMKAHMEEVTRLIQDLERDRALKFGELANQLRMTGEQTAALSQVTQALRTTLAGTKSRGQWGERMAEDVLRTAGFIEGINYTRQTTLQRTGKRPDFTILLPHDLVLHMDVKFPLDNYVRYRETETGSDREAYLKAFLRDVRNRMKELTQREYIDTEKGTIDCVLLFIPNEQVFRFMHEKDPGLLDEAFAQKVVLCSPITLFAVLKVIHQAVDAYIMEKTSSEILRLLGAFDREWNKFSLKLDKLGNKISALQEEYDHLRTTRSRQLERSLNRIRTLREQRGLLPSDSEEKGPGI